MQRIQTAIATLPLNSPLVQVTTEQIVFMMQQGTTSYMSAAPKINMLYSSLVLMTKLEAKAEVPAAGLILGVIKELHKSFSKLLEKKSEDFGSVPMIQTKILRVCVTTLQKQYTGKVGQQINEALEKLIALISPHESHWLKQEILSLSKKKRGGESKDTPSKSTPQQGASADWEENVLAIFGRFPDLKKDAEAVNAFAQALIEELSAAVEKQNKDLITRFAANALAFFQDEMAVLAEPLKRRLSELVEPYVQSLIGFIGKGAPESGSELEDVATTIVQYYHHNSLLPNPPQRIAVYHYFLTHQASELGRELSCSPLNESFQIKFFHKVKEYHYIIPQTFLYLFSDLNADVLIKLKDKGLVLDHGFLLKIIKQFRIEARKLLSEEDAAVPLLWANHAVAAIISHAEAVNPGAHLQAAEATVLQECKESTTQIRKEFAHLARLPNEFKEIIGVMFENQKTTSALKTVQTMAPSADASINPGLPSTVEEKKSSAVTALVTPPSQLVTPDQKEINAALEAQNADLLKKLKEAEEKSARLETAHAAQLEQQRLDLEMRHVQELDQLTQRHEESSLQIWKQVEQLQQDLETRAREHSQRIQSVVRKMEASEHKLTAAQASEQTVQQKLLKAQHRKGVFAQRNADLNTKLDAETRLRQERDDLVGQLQAQVEDLALQLRTVQSDLALKTAQFDSALKAEVAKREAQEELVGDLDEQVESLSSQLKEVEEATMHALAIKKKFRRVREQLETSERIASEFKDDRRRVSSHVKEKELENAQLRGHVVALEGQLAFNSATILSALSVPLVPVGVPILLPPVAEDKQQEAKAELLALEKLSALPLFRGVLNDYRWMYYCYRKQTLGQMLPDVKSAFETECQSRPFLQNYVAKLPDAYTFPALTTTLMEAADMVYHWRSDAPVQASVLLQALESLNMGFHQLVSQSAPEDVTAHDYPRYSKELHGYTKKLIEFIQANAATLPSEDRISEQFTAQQMSPTVMLELDGISHPLPRPVFIAVPVEALTVTQTVPVVR